MPRAADPPADPGPALTVTAHPPERARRPGPVVLPCACCSCCCCCLHTIGGIVGAAIGSVQEMEARPRRPVDPDFPFPFRRDEFEDEGPLLPATLLYWLLVLFLIGVVTVWFSVANGFRGTDDLIGGVVVALLVLPGLQLGASLLSLIAVALFYPQKAVPLARLGKITLWSFMGSIIGLLAIGGCCGVFGLLGRR